MARVDWRDHERAFPRAVPELARLARRARHRVGVAIVAALAIAGVTAGIVALRSGTYEAHIILRMSEGVAGEQPGMSRGEFRGYVESALLTRPVLLEIIEDETLLEAERKHGDQIAIDALRRALHVEIFDNFFATMVGSSPRSLRIRVSYRSNDRDEAISVVRKLARMIESAKAERWQWRLSESSERAQSVLARTERRVDARERELGERITELQRAEARGDFVRAKLLRLRLRHMDGLLTDERAQLRDARVEHGELELRHAASRARLGILFAVVDETIPPPPPSSPWISLALIGGAVFLLSLPLAGITASAFDRRLLDRDDVARAGVTVLGHVPRLREPGRGAPRSRR